MAGMRGATIRMTRGYLAQMVEWEFLAVAKQLVLGRKGGGGADPHAPLKTDPSPYFTLAQPQGVGRVRTKFQTQIWRVPVRPGHGLGMTVVQPWQGFQKRFQRFSYLEEAHRLL